MRAARRLRHAWRLVAAVAAVTPSDNTADGTQLQIYTCNGTAAQQFALS